MEYRQFVEDFAGRTLENLELVEGHGRHDITQLVNSLYGLIVVPQQTVLELLPNTTLRELASQGWAQFTVDPADKRRENPQCDTLRQLITSLRHGVAHAKLDFEADGAGHLSAITITNEHKGKFWRGSISTINLRSFVTRFAELLCSPGVLDHIP